MSKTRMKQTIFVVDISCLVNNKVLANAATLRYTVQARFKRYSIQPLYLHLLTGRTWFCPSSSSHFVAFLCRPATSPPSSSFVRVKPQCRPRSQGGLVDILFPCRARPQCCLLLRALESSHTFPVVLECCI